MPSSRKHFPVQGIPHETEFAPAQAGGELPSFCTEAHLVRVHDVTAMPW